jgi:hypothetical protein
MPGALTFDFLEGYLADRVGIRNWMWPIVVVTSLLEWWLAWTCCYLAESFGDETFLGDLESACVRGDACVQQTTGLDGSPMPTPSPLRALSSSLAESSDRMMLMQVTIEVRWSVASLILSSMTLAALSLYCLLACSAKILLLMVWHPQSVLFFLTFAAAAAVLCCEDDENLDCQPNTAESWHRNANAEVAMPLSDT